MAWLTGVVTSDGDLAKGSVRRITVASKDQEMIDLVAQLVPLPRYCTRANGNKRVATTWPNFYDFLLDVGVTPAKSLVIGALNIPDQWFFDFLRGEIDGDGHVGRHHGTSPQIRIYSGSRVFLDWLQATIHRLTDANSQKIGRTFTAWQLTYGGSQAMSIAPLIWNGNRALSRKVPEWLASDTRVAKGLTVKERTAVQQLAGKMPIRAIARQLNLDRCTVRRAIRRYLAETVHDGSV